MAMRAPTTISLLLRSLLIVVVVVASTTMIPVASSFAPSPRSTIRSHHRARNSVIVVSSSEDIDDIDVDVSRSSSNVSSRRSAITNLLVACTTSTALLPLPQPAHARLEGVNRPDLLPSDPDMNVIQVEKFLTAGQAKRMDDMLRKLEADTGYRVRVLCQAYPRTPGLAIRDYWSLGKEGQKDDKYIVLVVDEFGGKGNVLNFNVGEGVKFALPNVFWTRLTGKYGTTFFVKENGIDLAITNAVEAIVSCLRSEDQFCVNVPDEGMNLRSLGM